MNITIMDKFRTEPSSKIEQDNAWRERTCKGFTSL